MTTAALVVAVALVAFLAWFAWEIHHAPPGCDDCQGTDPWCTCHIHTTSDSESYPRRWPHP